jgi:hypothetical protein
MVVMKYLNKILDFLFFIFIATPLCGILLIIIEIFFFLYTFAKFFNKLILFFKNHKYEKHK